MSTTTANYNLVKPDYGDVADISVINKNMDVLDDELKKLTDEVNSNIGDINNSIDGTNANVASNTEAISKINEDYLSKTQKGAVSGIAELDENGKIVTSQLPSYVDEVVEANTIANFPKVGESGKIYVTLDTNLSYRWGGTAYVEISKSLALGETSNTAYRGDYGKVAYEHTNKKDNPHGVTKSQVGLANVDNTADVDKPVSKATQELLDNLAVGTADGNNITVQDSAGAPFSGLMVEGKSEQASYTGKNLLNATLSTTTLKGVTCTANGDGTYILNGTATSFVTFSVMSFPFLTSNSYKLVGCPQNGTTSTYFLTISSSTTEIGVSKTDDIGDGVSFTPTIDNNATIEIRVMSGTTVNNLLFKPMLTTDLEATYDDFEPYCGGIPSPNPDYPQTINSVADSGSIEVVSCGKNIAKIKALNNGTNLGITYTPVYENGILQYINVNGTATNNYYFYDLYNTQIPSGEYIASFNVSGISGVICQIYGVKNSVSTYLYSQDNGLDKKFTYNRDDFDYLGGRLYVVKGTKIDNVKIYPMIRPATIEDSTYEPFQETKATLTLSEPLRSLPNGVSDELVFNADGTGKIIRRIASVVYDGSDDEGWEFGNTFGTDVKYSDYRTTVNNIAFKNNGYGSIGHCTHYSCKDSYGTLDPHIYADGKAVLHLYHVINDDVYDISTFKTWLSENNVTVQYEIATPTEEILTAEQLNELLKLRTYESVSNINTNDSLQPNLEVEYYKNTNVGKALGNIKSQLVSLIKQE